MADIRIYPKQFMVEFIELYRSFPCLWNVKSKDYKDRHFKDIAYRELQKKLQEIDVDATKDTAIKKIGAMRSSFRRELKKVLQSKWSGAGAEEVYVPRLWYYSLLMFLKDTECPRESISTIHLEDDFAVIEESDSGDDVISESQHDTSVTKTSSKEASCSRSNINSARKRKTKEEKSDQILSAIENLLTNAKVEDGADIFGKNVAVKIKYLPKKIRLTVEKLINEVLCEAEMGTLNVRVSLKNPTAEYEKPYSTAAELFSGFSE